MQGISREPKFTVMEDLAINPGKFVDHFDSTDPHVGGGSPV